MSQRVDVIWILDDSSSMPPLWPEVGENFDAHMQFVEAGEHDARIFVRFLEGGWVVDEFLSVKGLRNTHLFSFNAISGGLDGCETEDGLVARPAPRLVEIANRTEGVEESICTKDWSRTLEELRQSGFPTSGRFFLTDYPVIQTIEVHVDDEPVLATEPSGQVNWTYDFSTNSVNCLPRSVPGAGSAVRVRYEVDPCP